MMNLFEHQKEAISFFNQKQKCIVSLDQGLGKTAVACSTFTKNERVLVVCPATLKLNWQREVLMWSENKNVQVINKKTDKFKTGKTIIIINYDILGRKQLRPKKDIVFNFNFFDFDKIVLDESQYIKNSTAVRSLICAKICITTPKVILLSGTPMERPRDLFMQLKSVGELKNFKTFHDYALRYCNARKVLKFGHQMWDYDGSSNEKELRSLVHSKMIRRTKDECLDLPDKLINIIEFSNNSPDKEYKLNRINITEDDLPDELIDNMSVYLRECGLKKLKDSIMHIDLRLESHQKIFVVTRHQEVIDKLFYHFSKDYKCVKLDGRNNLVQKQSAVDTFQNDTDCRLFFGQMKASGVGITLTASSHVIVVETSWSYTDLMQVIDRCHRIGQKETVTAEILVQEKTLDSIMVNRMMDKKSNIERIIENE